MIWTVSGTGRFYAPGFIFALIAHQSQEMVAPRSRPVIQGLCEAFMKDMPRIATITTLSLLLTIGLAVAQSPPTRPLADPIIRLEDGLLRWPVSAADAAYRAIDGRHLHAVVEDFAAIARRYQRRGPPAVSGVELSGLRQTKKARRISSDDFSRSA